MAGPDLTRIGFESVHFVPAGELEQERSDPRLVHRTADFRGVTTFDGVLDATAEALSFPSCGRSWDALLDRLADLEWLGEPDRYVLTVVHGQQL